MKMKNQTFGSSLPRVLLFMLSISVGEMPAAGLIKTVFAQSPDHVVLVILDGVSYKVWNKARLPNLEGLAAGGALVREVHLPPPAHPRSGPYAKLHTCSIPNPIMMSGTVFIDGETKYLSQQFFPEKRTAFSANTISYTTLNIGYHYSYQKEGDDRDAIEMAAAFMKMGRPAFMRVHLQDLGSAGSGVMRNEKEPWKNDIWHPDSPYRSKLNDADRLIGDFISRLRETEVLEKTALIIVGDHGQADSGWHPLEIADSAVTTMVLWGAGIKPGAVLEYAELIDVAPTVCALMGVAPPSTAIGRVLGEVFLSPRAGQAGQPSLFIKELNEQFRAFRVMDREAAWLMEKAPEFDRGKLFSRLNAIRQGFYDIHRFSEWPRFRTIEELMRQNTAALERMTDLLKKVKNEGLSPGGISEGEK